MATILIPVDLSANARNAAEHALRLFGPEGNTFVLAHAYLDPNLLDPALPSMNEALREAAEAGLGDLATALRALPGLAKADVQREVRLGTLTNVLADLVEDRSPACIVMGTQGASGLQGTLFGSNTADVIRSSTVPVLAVPEGSRYRAPARIVLADDGAPVRPGTIDLLLDIARWSRSEVMIVRVLEEGADPDQVSGSSYDDLLGGVPHSHHVLSADNVTTALNDLVDQSDADLVVMVHRHLGFFASIFHSSNSKRLVMHTHVPLLVLEQ